MSQRRDVSVQSLRGIAVVLMVAGHVIGSDSTRGLQVVDDSWWRFSYVALEDLRMPLFTLISGFVYAMRPVVGGRAYGQLVRGKVRRLLVPLVTVGALLFVTESVVPSVHRPPARGSFWRIYVFGFEHLWFLQAIFLIFVLVGVLDRFALLARPASWAAVLAGSCLLDVIVHLPGPADVFSVDEALQLLPFFLLGLGIRRFAGLLDRTRYLTGALPVFAAVFAVRLALLLERVSLPALPERLLSLAVGMAGLVSLFLLRSTLRSRPLAWLGGFSFTIYLLHVFAAAAARMVLGAAGVRADGLLFVLCLAAGIGVPVLFELSAGRSRWISWGLLGQKPSFPPWTLRDRQRPAEIPSSFSAGSAAPDRQ